MQLCVVLLHHSNLSLDDAETIVYNLSLAVKTKDSFFNRVSGMESGSKIEVLVLPDLIMGTRQVDPRAKLDISDGIRTRTVIRGADYRSPDRAILTVTGAVVSLLLHGLLFTPLLWGSHRHRPHLPPFQGASASRDAVNSRESMMVIFSEDSDATHDLSSSDDRQIPVLMPPQIKLAAIGRPNIPEPNPVLDNANDDQALEAQGDGGGHAMMFGRYVGQISARVERAWVRPRVALASGAFECRVEITQDRLGNVQEVILKRCTDQPQWQISLVKAIQQASPLPAPPEPAVFSNLLTMEFDSEPYVVGGSAEGFEADPKIASTSAAPTVTRQMRADGSMNLTIVGPSR